MEVIKSEPVKREFQKGKYTKPLPTELLEDASDYALMNKHGTVESRCDEEHVLSQLNRYATDPDYHLENIRQFFSISQSSLRKLLHSEKYKDEMNSAKVARAHMLVQDGLATLKNTHQRISSGEEVPPQLLKSSEVLAKYEMQYACMLNPEFSGKREGNGDTNIQINVQTPMDIKEL